MAKTVDDFVSLGLWTNGGGVSLSPAGWAYHPGNGGATGYIYRTKAAGEVYVETKCYLDVNSSDWLMIKIDTSTNPLFNVAAADGAGLAMRGSGAGFAYLGGTTTGWGGSWTLSTRPGAATTACTLGIYRRSSTNYDFYCNGVLLGNQVTNTATTGLNVCVGGYNGVGAHFDYFASADHVLSLYEDRNAPAALVI